MFHFVFTCFCICIYSVKKSSASVFLTSLVACGLLAFPYLATNCFHQDFKTSQESLKSFSFNKYTVESFALRCCWKLHWEYVRVAGLYATTFFCEDLTVEKVHLLFPFTRSFSYKNCTRFSCRILLSVLFFSIFVRNKNAELGHVLFTSSVSSFV